MVQFIFATARSTLPHRHFHNHVQKRDLPVSDTLPDPWTFQECYTYVLKLTRVSSFD